MSAPDDGSRMTGDRPGRPRLVAIVSGALMVLLLGFVALVALSEAYRTEGTAKAVWSSAAAALGLAGLVVGVRLVRGRPPRRRNWLAAGAASVVLLLVPTSDERDFSGSDVNPAVRRAYLEHKDVRRAVAACDYADENADGLESWWCDVETQLPIEYDTCRVDVRRAPGGGVVVTLTYCLSDDL